MLRSNRLIRSFLQPEPGLLDRKMEEHRGFSAAMGLVSALTAILLWAWDRALDPAGARRTFGPRLLLAAMFLVFAGVVRRGGRRRVEILGCLLSLGGEACFVLLLTRLRGGMVYGLSGFMYFFFVPFVLFQGFSLRSSLLYTFLAALLPQLLALAGLAPGFPQVHYAALIWPATFLTGVAQVAFARNYLARYLSELRLEHASNTDPLTGVSNRRRFMPLLAQELARCRRFRRPLALLMLDIDRFKGINDAFGHPAGDEVLRRVARACEDLSRGSDVVARLGGEEFAVLLPESDLPGALAFAERLREDVERLEIQVPGRPGIRCTVSVGVADFQGEDPGEEDLLRRADDALYRAKAEGRNRVSPSPSANAPA